MTQIPDELLLYRSQLRDAVARDLSRRTPRRRAIPAVGVLLAAAAAIVLGLTFNAASTPSAYAAAKQALARTQAASSGTMTLGGGFGEITTEWNDGNIALTGGKVLGPLQQFLIVGTGLYVQQDDGTWLHYADADNVPDVLAGRVRLARANVAGNTADQVLALASGVTQSAQPDGTTVYTGTIPKSTVDPDTVITPSDSVLTKAILSHRLGDPGDPPMRLRMVVGSDGLVQELAITGGGAMKFAYSHFESTPPILAPANAAEMAPDAVPPDFKGGGLVYAAK